MTYRSTGTRLDEATGTPTHTRTLFVRQHNEDKIVPQEPTLARKTLKGETMKEGSASLLALSLLVFGCVSIAVLVHHQQQQQSGTTANTNFYHVDHHPVHHPVHESDDDDAAVVTDSLKDMILTHEMKELFHSWRQEFAIEYKTAKELEERMQVWLQNHGMSFVIVIAIVVLALCVCKHQDALIDCSSARSGTCTALRCTIDS